jgi:hypothetical protein
MTRPNVHLRVYDTFTEVISRVESEADQLQLTFTAEAWREIKPQSLTLMGLPYSAMTVTPQLSWLSSLEGKRIGLRSEGGQQNVTLIRAEDVLVQDEQGNFFHTRPDQLLFPDLPPPSNRQGAVQVCYQLSGSGEGTFAYVTDAVKWSAQYHLSIAGDGQVALTGYASLHNASDQPLHPDALTLIAGEVRQVAARRHRHDFLMMQAAHSEPSWRENEDREEVHGLYTFNLHQPPILPAHSTVSVPFDLVDVTAWKQWTVIQTSFTHAPEIGGMGSREGRLQTARALLGATVTLREQEMIIGEQRIPETAAGEEIRLVLGRDPNVLYSRRVEQLKVDLNPVSEPAAALEDDEVLQTIRVTYTLRNTGRKTVHFRVEEETYRVSVRQISGDLTLAGSQLRAQGTLSAQDMLVLTAELQIVTTADRLRPQRR